MDGAKAKSEGRQPGIGKGPGVGGDRGGGGREGKLGILDPEMGHNVQ